MSESASLSSRSHPRTDVPRSRTEPLPHGVTPELLAKLSGLELRARTIVEGVMSGRHRSPHRGFSVEFAEHREYVPGDDLRYVDWKVYGKSDRYFLKQFEEETNFTCYVLLDVSESMRYRSESAALSKLEYAAAVAAALSYLIFRQQDAVGLMTFDDAVRESLRPSSTPSQFDPLLRVLEALDAGRVATVEEMSTAAASPQTAPEESEDVSLEPALREAASRIPRRGLVILLSDLFAAPEGVERGLKLLHHGRHDVIVGQVIDPAEEDFPFEESTRFIGLEGQGERRVEPRSMREAYRRQFEAFLRQSRRSSRELGMDYHLMRTDKPLDIALSEMMLRQRSGGSGVFR